MTEATEDISVRVLQYRQIRDAITALKDRHEKELEKPKAVLEQLGGILDAHLLKNGEESVKTKNGTFFRSTRFTATVNDGAAFMQHIIDNQLWDLIERRANATAVRGFAETHKHLPPGVNLNSITSVNVRAPTGGKGALKDISTNGEKDQ
jgi:hypothetical protein